MSLKRFEALDAFRGLCAVAVVIYHTHILNAVSQVAFFRGSDIFVEFFFVLSGFVLTHGYGFRQDLTFVHFMKARFFRLYPLHIFMLFVFILLECGKLIAFKYGGISFNFAPFTGQFALTELIPNLLLLQSWTPFTHHLSFNSPAWSISIEFYLYALLFISIVTFKTKRVFSWGCISLIAFMLLFLKSDLLVESVLRGLSCFFGGAVTYVIYRHTKELKIKPNIGSVLEVLLLVLVVAVVSSAIEYRNILASLLFLFTVYIFSFESGIISNSLKMPIFQYAGKLSYSIYMTHTAILFCIMSVAMVFNKITGQQITQMIGSVRTLDIGGSIPSNLLLLAIIAIVFLVSHFTYKFIELKGLALGKKLPRLKKNIGL